MYKASLISVSEDLIKDVNKLLYGFIWKGNDKIKCTALINDIENSGLKMLDVQSMILSQRVMALKRFIEDYISPWKSILETLVENLFYAAILIQSNLDYPDLLGPHEIVQIIESFFVFHATEHEISLH